MTGVADKIAIRRKSKTEYEFSRYDPKTDNILTVTYVRVRSGQSEKQFIEEGLVAFDVEWRMRQENNNEMQIGEIKSVPARDKPYPYDLPEPKRSVPEIQAAISLKDHSDCDHT